MPLALVGVHRRLASHTVRYSVVAVGKAKGTPYADDLAHYAKLLSRYARVDVIEVADDDALQRRIPERAYVCLLDSRGRATRPRRSRLARGAPPGRASTCAS